MDITRDAYREWLNKLFDVDYMELWNGCCDDYRYSDIIYVNDETFFTEFFSPGDDPYQWARTISRGVSSQDFCMDDAYVWIDDLGHLHSTNSIKSASCVDESILIDWLIENEISIEQD